MYLVEKKFQDFCRNIMANGVKNKVLILSVKSAVYSVQLVLKKKNFLFPTKIKEKLFSTRVYMTRRRVVDIYRYVLRPTLECKPGRGHCMHFIRKLANSENVDYCFCKIIVGPQNTRNT